jgi:hypothetical protein
MMWILGFALCPSAWKRECSDLLRQAPVPGPAGKFARTSFTPRYSENRIVEGVGRLEGLTFRQIHVHTSG